jgi:hypothetical protein
MLITPLEKRLSIHVRLLTAIFIGIALFAANAVVFLAGILVAAFSLDSCSDLPDWPFWYLYGLWPLVLLVAALGPSILLVINLRWWWIALATILSVPISIGAFFLWFPILSIVC